MNYFISKIIYKKIFFIFNFLKMFYLLFENDDIAIPICKIKYKYCKTGLYLIIFHGLSHHWLKIQQPIDQYLFFYKFYFFYQKKKTKFFIHFIKKKLQKKKYCQLLRNGVYNYKYLTLFIFSEYSNLLYLHKYNRSSRYNVGSFF